MGGPGRYFMENPQALKGPQGSQNSRLLKNRLLGWSCLFHSHPCPAAVVPRVLLFLKTGTQAEPGSPALGALVSLLLPVLAARVLWGSRLLQAECCRLPQQPSWHYRGALMSCLSRPRTARPQRQVPSGCRGGT